MLTAQANRGQCLLFQKEVAVRGQHTDRPWRQKTSPGCITGTESGDKRKSLRILLPWLLSPGPSYLSSKNLFFFNSLLFPKEKREKRFWGTVDYRFARLKTRSIVGQSLVGSLTNCGLVVLRWIASWLLFSFKEKRDVAKRRVPKVTWHCFISSFLLRRRKDIRNERAWH